MANPEIIFKNKIDIELLQATWKLAYHKDININYFKWWLQNNPYQAYVMVDSELASFYNIMPVDILVNNKTERAGLMNMALTHPDHQSKGYFIQLELGLHEVLKNEDFYCAFGFANHQAHRLHRKHAGWKDLSALNQMRLHKKNVRFSLSSFSDFNFETGQLNNEIILQLGNLVYSGSRIKFSRNNEYLSWRLLENPLNTYFYKKIFLKDILNSVIIFKKFNQSIDIMEIFYLPLSQNFKSLEAGIKSFMEMSDTINIWSNLHSDEHLLLEKIGFIEEEFNTYFGVIPFKNNDDLLQITNWHYRFIDSDVF